jgi:predicted TPR repeat methyltransferase
MNQNPCKYDVITSAATLIHFGDLKPVLQAAAAALRDEGTLICTLFPDDNEKENGIAVDTATGLAKGGCYRHGRNYIRRVAGETGFSVEMLETAVHEYPQKDQPAMGLVVALRRNPGKSS